MLEACSPLHEGDNLAVFPEHTVKASITKDLNVNGNIDYIIATAKHPPGVQEEQLLGGSESPQKPYFCVVEAKRDQSFNDGISINFVLMFLKALVKLLLR